MLILADREMLGVQCSDRQRAINTTCDLYNDAAEQNDPERCIVAAFLEFKRLIPNTCAPLRWNQEIPIQGNESSYRSEM